MKIIDGQLFLTVDELVEFGVPRGTIHNGISSFRNNKTMQWMHLGEKEGSGYFLKPLVSFEYLPAQTKKKLPAKKDLLKSLLQESELTNKIAQLTAV